MGKSNSETKPQTTSNVIQTDRRVGIEGSGNVVLGDNSPFSYSSKDTSAAQRIKGDSNFAPVFQFTGNVTNKQRTTAPLSMPALRTLKPHG